MTDPLAFARSLEERDSSLAEAAATLAALEARTASIRAGAAKTAFFLIRAPGERERLGSALSEAESRLAAKEAAERAAAERLSAAERSGAEDEIRAARNALVAARDAAATARRRRDEIAAEVTVLESAVAAAETETETLLREAAVAASELRATGRVSVAEPANDLDGVERWAAAARSALFVARGAVQRQREAVVREASELASSVLGDPAYAGGAALVRERLERALNA